MKIITRLVFLAGFLLVTTVAGSEFNLDSLLVKSVGGPGAADIISNMTTYKTTGTVSLNGQPGSFVEYFAPPNRSYLKIDLMGFIMVQAYDGETAWQMDQNGQALELDGFEKREIQKGLYFNSFAYLFPNRVPGGRAYLAKGTVTANRLEAGVVTVKVAGQETTLGRSAAEKLLVAAGKES